MRKTKKTSKRRMSPRALSRRDATRDLGAVLLASVREMKGHQFKAEQRIREQTIKDYMDAKRAIGSSLDEVLRDFAKVAVRLQKQTGAVFTVRIHLDFTKVPT